MLPATTHHYCWIPSFNLKIAAFRIQPALIKMDFHRLYEYRNFLDATDAPPFHKQLQTLGDIILVSIKYYHNFFNY